MYVDAIVDAIVEMIHDERIIRCDVKNDLSYTRMITCDFIWSWALYEYLLDMYTTDDRMFAKLLGH
jgi:hypothetical protein